MAEEARKETHALATTLEQLRGPLMRYFRRRVDSLAEAEDLTQEAFARIIGASNGGEVRNPHSFVFQVAVNLLRDRGRAAKVRNEAQVSVIDPHRVSELTHEFVEDVTPERVLLGRDDIEEAIRVLGELGERTRDIYILFRLENMTHPEIAALYGISRSTVEKEVMRATFHLGSRMKGKVR